MVFFEASHHLANKLDIGLGVGSKYVDILLKLDGVDGRNEFPELSLQVAVFFPWVTDRL